MRLLAFFLFLALSCNCLLAQQVLRNPVERNGWTQLAANGQLFNFFGMRPQVKGSVYLYDRWKNIAILETKEDQKVLLRNVNFNVDTQRFEALFSGDSIFTLNTKILKSVTLNNKKYTTIDHKGISKQFEVLYQASAFSILKEYKLNVFEASYNPMVTRKQEQYTKRQRFYLYKNGDFDEIVLNKKHALKILAHIPQEDLEEFVKKNQLSFKEEIDWLSLVKHFVK